MAARFGVINSPITNSYLGEQARGIFGESRIELIRAVFAKGALFRLTAKGLSMFPFIQDNDIITISPLSQSPVKLGKIVAFICPTYNKLLVHRVIAKRKELYLIKGDNVSKPDCLINKENILGCVITIQRNSRNMLLGLGPERVIIAVLSRIGILNTLHFLSKLLPDHLRRFIKCKIFS